MPFIESTIPHRWTAEGRAIGGMSRGAVWSLEIAFRNPARFAAVGGHSAALNVNQAPQMYDPLYLAADLRSDRYESTWTPAAGIGCCRVWSSFTPPCRQRRWRMNTISTMVPTTTATGPPT